VPRLALPDLKLHYLQMGDRTIARPPLLLIHGLAASAGFWLRAASALAEQRPLLLYDLRGHGRSEMPADGYDVVTQAADLVRLLDALAIPTCHAAAHSFGGSILLEAACQHPDRFQTLTLADTRWRAAQPLLTPSAWPRWEERRSQLAALGITLSDDEPEAGLALLTALARLSITLPTPSLADPGAAAAADAAQAAFPRWLIEFLGQRQSKPMAERWLTLIARPGVHAAFTADDTLTAERLGRLHLPVLALYGAHSPILPSGHALARALPACTSTIVADAGHFFPAFKPERFTTPLLTHLARHEHP